MSDWRERCEIGWKKFDYYGKQEFWVRITSGDGLYWWLHPTENRWVGEPEQITMPTFKTGKEAEDAIRKAPVPPGFCREITAHKVNGCNDRLGIHVTDAPGSGGANHEYLVTLPDGSKLHNFIISADGGGLMIPFQKGPVGESGVNGVTNEALLAIVIDRLQAFQRGKFSCRENAIALTHLETAMLWLQKRTQERLSRGVEGTHKP